MRLISLNASEPTFKAIVFNKSGPSFILAKQSNPYQHDKQFNNLPDKNKTYNGVGKSLLIALIDFCLGASTSNNKITKSLQSKLPGWHFILEVETNNFRHTLVRHTSEPKYIFVNNKKLTLDEFYSLFAKLCFDIPTELSNLTFRALLPFFLRSSKLSYINHDEPKNAGTPYQKQLHNAFLLGLDVMFAQEKMKLKKELEAVTKLHKSVKEDPILRQFFEGDKDSSLAIADLDEKIELLECDLQKFEVADDYYQVKQEADNIKHNIDKLQNTIELRKINLESINQSLIISPDITRNDIQDVYNESKLVFQNNVEKKLLDLEKFYENLTINRTIRLNDQKRKITKELHDLEIEFTNLKKALDSHLKFLAAHRAIDVFTSISSHLAELKQNREKLQGYENLQYEYEQKKISLKKNIIFQSEATANYLVEAKNDIEGITSNFRMLVKKFYPEALAGVTVHNNNGENQIRYNIEAKIQSDSSDGINNVKLFCYDLTLLMCGANHYMNFIFHDSRLFSDIDEMHSNVLFEIVRGRFADKQYIASINQDKLNSLDKEVQDFIKSNVVCELTDDTDDGKLLGITVELEYD